MKDLIKNIKSISPKTEKIIKKRMDEFKSFKDKNNKFWFSELCFCILTANSKAESGIAIQKELGASGLINFPPKKIKECIISHKHRFHNNKTSYIVKARKHLDNKQKIVSIVKNSGETEAREWLVKNIKGIGYKEASHFMRNVGFSELSILDRHILRCMKEYGFIRDIPKTITKKRYIEIEKDFITIAKKAGMTPAELDLRMWYLMTGKILK